jgi:hypothetical protein
MKVLFGMALRQTMGFVESLLRLIGLDWAVPDFSTLSMRQKTLTVRIPYRGSKGPLHLLIDSTGIKAEGEGEWHARGHGGAKRRLWRKIHLGVDEETLEIRAIEFTGNQIGDAPMLPEMLDQKVHMLLGHAPIIRTMHTYRRLLETPEEDKSLFEKLENDLMSKHRLRRTWVDYFNNRRILEPIGNNSPAEAEANFCATLERADMAA